MISNKTLNSLQRAGLTLGEAQALSELDLMRIPSIGKIAIREIRGQPPQEPMGPPRIVKQIIQAAGTLYALANDGTLWFMTDDGWRQEHSLPQPE